MKQFFKKYFISILISAMGLLGGFLYWKIIGCKTGSCPITSNWHTSVIAGGLIGYLIGDSVKDYLQKKKTK